MKTKVLQFASYKGALLAITSFPKVKEENAQTVVYYHGTRHKRYKKPEGSFVKVQENSTEFEQMLSKCCPKFKEFIGYGKNK